MYADFGLEYTKDSTWKLSRHGCYVATLTDDYVLGFRDYYGVVDAAEVYWQYATDNKSLNLH